MSDIRTVWKYPITTLDDFVSVSMPRGAEILDVQFQRGVLTMWALVLPTEPHVVRHFRIAGTGHQINEDPCDYIGTAQDVEGGFLVWHLFEVTPPSAR